jgi:hypothetical protein
MRLIATALLTITIALGLVACAGTDTAVGITTNEAAYAEEKRPLKL